MDGRPPSRRPPSPTTGDHVVCRIFGFRSVIESQVHQSLLSADNALAVQSRVHPHGWGVAYYLEDTPHLIKSTDTAGEDHIFQRVSGVVASQTVLAHVRKATVGGIHVLNAHPFQFGRWIFAHNGNVAGFARLHPKLRTRILPRLRRYVLGDTDSEVLFYLFLSRLSERVDLHRRGTSIPDMAAALKATVDAVLEDCDGSLPEDTEEEPSKLTMIVTDGHAMVAVRHQVQLYYSSYKNRCSERASCPYLAPECESPTETGYVNHLIISSEPLQDENVWQELEEDGYVGVDWRMRLHRGRIDTIAPDLEDHQVV